MTSLAIKKSLGKKEHTHACMHIAPLHAYQSTHLTTDTLHVQTMCLYAYIMHIVESLHEQELVYLTHVIYICKLENLFLLKKGFCCGLSSTWYEQWFLLNARKVTVCSFLQLQRFSRTKHGSSAVSSHAYTNG